MKRFKLSKRAYLSAFIFVMFLNAFLAVFLLRNVFAQISDDKTKNQPPVIAEIVNQNNSPLRITITNVDNSNKDYQEINYSVQNVSNKDVRAYVVLHHSKSNGDRGTTIRRFGTKLFHPNEFDNVRLSEERNLIKPDDALFLSIDYVEFDDGSSWGNDTARQSEYIAGSRAGWKEAVKQSKLIYNQKGTTLTEFLGQDSAEIISPPVDTSQTSKWQEGFRSGYRAAIATLQKAYKNQGVKAVQIKLNEMEKAVD
ncbi:MAG TPA: hypothetical protein VK400_00790 [Pyrinomonadaceae bacterium]|nr:hypothetical protein [Pyrinomonadaceae bacterium]